MYKIKNNMCPTYISTLIIIISLQNKYKLRNHDLTQSPLETALAQGNGPEGMELRSW